MAWNSSTCATLVWASARMKQHEAIASATATATPGASDAAESGERSPRRRSAR